MSRDDYRGQYVTIYPRAFSKSYGNIPDVVREERFPAGADGEYYLASAYLSIGEWVVARRSILRCVRRSRNWSLGIAFMHLPRYLFHL